MAGTSRFSAKQERCIKKVKATGRSKVSAIKICQSRIKKKDIMARKNRKKARRQRRKAKLKALAKDILNEEALDAEEEDEDQELVQEIVEELAEELPEDDEETEQVADIIDNLSDEELEEVIEEAVVELAAEEVEEKKPAPEVVEEVAPAVVQEETPQEETEESEEEKSISAALSVLFKAVVAKVKKKDGDTESKISNSFIIEKDKNGDYRWIGKATNKYIDREGDILTDKSHKEFTKYLDKNPDMAPIFLPWHNIKSAFTHPVDSWMYKNGFVMYSGKLEEEEAKSLMEIAKTTKLGMSHGFIALDREFINKKNITRYRTFEVSVLPLHNAANPFTELEVIAKEANMERKEFLKELLEDEKIAKILQDTEVAEKVLDGAGVQSKDVIDPKEDAVMEQIGKALGLPELSDAFAVMVKELKEGREERETMATLIKAMADQIGVSQEAQEEQLAKMIEAPANKYAWQERASQTKDNLVDETEDAELLKNAPALEGEHWLGQSTHTQSIRATKEELAQLV